MGRVAFKQCDVERLLRAAKAVGYSNPVVHTLPDGSLKLLTGTEPDAKPLSPLEAWRREHGHRAP